MSRLSKALVIGAVATFAAFAALLYLRTRFEITYGSSANKTAVASGARVDDMSSAERRTFLAGDYVVVRKVADLPIGMQNLYVMADPGERFEATDVIMDSTLPRRRLIFAGVVQNRAFIHYEQGGMAHTYVIELFRLDSAETAVRMWRGYCGRAESLPDLRRLAERCN
jgi:hypothetical protein